MSSFPNAPRVVRGGIVLIDPATGQLRRVIALQYNPDTLTRSFQVQHMGEGAERSDALRLKGPAVESIKLDAEIDAADQLEFPERNPSTVASGVAPQLAVLESLVNPTASALLENRALASRGTLEIAPMESPLPLFVWGAQRVVPVRVTELSITEEAFDPSLNPIRAKVSLGLRVLSVDDLGFDHRGGSLFMAYLQGRERLASLAATVGFEALGLRGAP